MRLHSEVRDRPPYEGLREDLIVYDAARYLQHFAKAFWLDKQPSKRSVGAISSQRPLPKIR